MIADITFECSHCGQRIAVGADAAGLDVDCPTCKTTLTIPSPETCTEQNPWSLGAEPKRERAEALSFECRLVDLPDGKP